MNIIDKFKQNKELHAKIYDLDKSIKNSIKDVFQANGWHEKEILIEVDDTSFAVTLPFGHIDFKELIDINNVMKMEGFYIKAIGDCQTREEDGVVIFFSKFDNK